MVVTNQIITKEQGEAKMQALDVQEPTEESGVRISLIRLIEDNKSLEDMFGPREEETLFAEFPGTGITVEDGRYFQKRGFNIELTRSEAYETLTKFKHFQRLVYHNTILSLDKAAKIAEIYFPRLIGVVEDRRDNRYASCLPEEFEHFNELLRENTIPSLDRAIEVAEICFPPLTRRATARRNHRYTTASSAKFNREEGVPYHKFCLRKGFQFDE